MKYFLLAALVALTSCSPKIKSSLEKGDFQALSKHTPVLTLRSGEAIPDGSLLLGKTFVGDTGFTTDCTYDVVLGLLEAEARNSGANILVITEIKTPDIGSTCYRIRAQLYRNTDISLVNEFIKVKEDRIKSRLPEDADYAMVHFYRPKNPKGALIGFKIRMDDETEIGRVRNGEKFSYRITDFGNHKFWAKTENIEEVIVTIERGKEYFFRCGVNFGAVVGRAQIEQVSTEIGIQESSLMEEN